MAIIPNLQAIKRAASISSMSIDATVSPMRFDLIEIAPVDGERQVTVRAADESAALELKIPSLENGVFDRPIYLAAVDVEGIKSAEHNGQATTTSEGGNLKTASRTFPHREIEPGTFPPIGEAVSRIHEPTGARAFVQLDAERLEMILRAMLSIKAKTIELSIPLEGDEFAPVGFEAIQHDYSEGKGLAILSPVAPISRPNLRKETDTKPAAPVASSRGTSETFTVPAGGETVGRAMREVSQQVRETAPAPVPSISLDSILDATIQGSAADPIPQGETETETATDTETDEEETPAADRKRGPISAKVSRGTGPSGNGIEIAFSGTPSIETRADLKSAGYRWSGRDRLWYARRSTGSERMAQIIENVFPTMD